MRWLHSYDTRSKDDSQKTKSCSAYCDERVARMAELSTLLRYLAKERRVPLQLKVLSPFLQERDMLINPKAVIILKCDNDVLCLLCLLTTNSTAFGCELIISTSLYLSGRTRWSSACAPMNDSLVWFHVSKVIFGQ